MDEFGVDRLADDDVAPEPVTGGESTHRQY